MKRGRFHRLTMVSISKSKYEEYVFVGKESNSFIWDKTYFLIILKNNLETKFTRILGYNIIKFMVSVKFKCDCIAYSINVS